MVRCDGRATLGKKFPAELVLNVAVCPLASVIATVMPDSP